MEYKELEKALMHGNFRSAGEIDSEIPNKNGLCCIRLSEHCRLAGHLKTIHASNPTDVVYIGMSNNMKRRLGELLQGKGHATLFRSIGAVLGYMPAKGSLTDKSNKLNYVFERRDKAKIIKWINANLQVCWATIDERDLIDTLGKTLIKNYQPLLNLKHNEKASLLLEKLIKQCRAIATAK